MNREQALKVLEPLDGVQMRRVEHTPRTKVEITPEGTVLRPGGGAHTIVFGEAGFNEMMSFLRLPEHIPHDLSPDTLGRVATDLLARKQWYSVTLKEGHAIGITAAKKAELALRSEKVLRTIEGAIGKADYDKVLLLPHYEVVVDVAGSKTLAVAKGDIVRAGASVKFSPLGTIEPLVQSYVNRLACTNGAVSLDVLRTYRANGGGGGEGDSVWQWFRESVKEAYKSVTGIVEQWQNLRKENLSDKDRAMVLEGLIRDAKLDTDTAKAVRALAVETPPHNTYDAMNLITYASSHLMEDPRAIVRARSTAATFANSQFHSRVCPVCRAKR